MDENQVKIIASTYEVIGVIGAGGGGVVYLARHLRLGKNVVLKANKRSASSRADRPEVLRREVDVLKNLSHTYIPQVYDYFVEDDVAYTVIDYVQGESLDRPLKRGERFSQQQVIRWGRQMMEALAYLHAPIHGDPPRGYIHSDIKPANLMVTPDGSIRLIDFNIALALGEESAVGLTVGYASPEHYGLDYSTEGSITYSYTAEARGSGAESGGEPETEDMDVRSARYPWEGDSSRRGVSGSQRYSSGAAGGRRVILPDARSDIYMAGATLYHLLSGTRPAKNAVDVVPLSETEYSPQLVRIISRAMNPNPDHRFQTAEEMLEALTELRKNDPRVLRLRRRCVTAAIALAAVFFVGVLTAFAGLKRMQTTEQRLKLAEYSREELSAGNVDMALSYALQALPAGRSPLDPGVLPEAQRALTNALGVYDLSDEYRSHAVIDMPAEPVCIALSPGGRTMACLCPWSLYIIDTDTCETLARLPAAESALAQVVYLDESTLLFAGAAGLTAYDLEAGQILWTGEPATAIALSGDGTRAAAVYRDEDHAVLYRTSDGEQAGRVDFGGRTQRVLSDDLLADPHENLLALNRDGSLLCVSYADGGLEMIGTAADRTRWEVLPAGSGYSAFEGGFYRQYFAFSASNAEDSAFVVIDTNSMEQTGGFHEERRMSVQTDENGVYLKAANILVGIDPVTGEQRPLVNSAESIRCFAVDAGQTLAAVPGAFRFYDSRAALIREFAAETPVDFAALAGGTAVVGSVDSVRIRILRRDDHAGAGLLSYDPAYYHSEARLSADGAAIMLFSEQGFRLYGIDGGLICEEEFSDAASVRDTQYRRDEGGSRLEVAYDDGRVLVYSATDGGLLRQETGAAPDDTLQEVFYTDAYEIIAPLHGAPQVLDRKSGKLLCTLSEDGYLAYIQQAGPYIVAQYIGDGGCYGQLMDAKLRVLADLPALCDVIDGLVLFDYPEGQIRASRVFEIDELKAMAEAQ